MTPNPQKHNRAMIYSSSSSSASSSSVFLTASTFFFTTLAGLRTPFSKALFKNSSASYSVRGLQSENFSENVRQIKLGQINVLNEIRLRRFFAQGDVDTIRNFPLPSSNPREEHGFGITVHPYYSLAYYANGKNLLVGLIKKLRTNDKELLTKLRTL